MGEDIMESAKYSDVSSFNLQEYVKQEGSIYRKAIEQFYENKNTIDAIRDYILSLDEVFSKSELMSTISENFKLDKDAIYDIIIRLCANGEIVLVGVDDENTEFEDFYFTVSPIVKEEGISRNKKM